MYPSQVTRLPGYPLVSRPDHPGLDAGGAGRRGPGAGLRSVADAAAATEPATGADAADDQIEACATRTRRIPMDTLW